MDGGDRRTTRPHVLVVEDDPSLRLLQEVRFRNEGYEVVAAVDGRQAEELIRARIPDAIVTDLLMPNVDGAELLRWVRSQEHLRHVPVVLYTALPSSTSTQQLLSLGGVHYVQKCATWDELRGVVRRVVA